MNYTVKGKGNVSDLPMVLVDEILDLINEVKDDDNFKPYGRFEFEDGVNLIVLDDSIIYQSGLLLVRLEWDFENKQII